MRWIKKIMIVGTLGVLAGNLYYVIVTGNNANLLGAAFSIGIISFVLRMS